MVPTPELSVIIPTYNERENIQRLLPRLAAALADVSYEVVVVDDCSPDGTGDAVGDLARAGHPARLISKPVKEGIGAALRVGYHAGRGRLLASLDADLSFDPADLRRLMTRVAGGADVVVGSRHVAGSAYEAPTLRVRFKRFTSRTTNALLRRLTGIPISDFTANMRVLRREAWTTIETQEKTNLLLFEMILKAYVRGFIIAEAPVAFRNRRFGESKLRLAREAPKFLRMVALVLARYRGDLVRRRAMVPERVPALSGRR